MRRGAFGAAETVGADPADGVDGADVAVNGENGADGPAPLEDVGGRRVLVLVFAAH